MQRRSIDGYNFSNVYEIWYQVGSVVSVWNQWWASHVGYIEEHIDRHPAVMEELIEVPPELDLRISNLKDAFWYPEPADDNGAPKGVPIQVNIQSIWHDEDGWHVGFLREAHKSQIATVPHPQDPEEQDENKGDGSMDQGGTHVGGDDAGNNSKALEEALKDLANLESEVADEEMAEDMDELALEER
jgi:hypothetical protein